MSLQQVRQEIYDRIKSSSKDQYVLEEMQRLGFWQKSDQPNLPGQLIKKETELHKELQELSAKVRKFDSQEAMLKEMHRERMKAKKAQREVTKQKHKQKLLDKAAHWKQLQTQQIIYLGKGVSGGLNQTVSNATLIQKNNLPFFEDVNQLAAATGLSLNDFRYLLFHREVSKDSHYHTFEIPKKSGGVRKISAPKKRLKALQQWILENILNKIPVTDAAHGFLKGKSIVSNANAHLQKDIVINIDLKDFFPSIHYARVKGLFQSLGYAEQLATIFALACTQALSKKVTLDGQQYFVQQAKRFLPQGSPASPAISNLIAYKLDRKLKGLAIKLGFDYSRYADDLSFSCQADNEKQIAKLLFFIKKICFFEGFEVHPQKTHIMRKSNRQEVTGIVVNEKPAIAKRKLHQFRALLHNIEQNGWQNQHWGKVPFPIQAIEGYIHFVNMVNPNKAAAFQQKLQSIILTYGYPYPDIVVKPVNITPQEKQDIKDVPTNSSDTTIEFQPKNENKPNADWWNIF